MVHVVIRAATCTALASCLAMAVAQEPELDQIVAVIGDRPVRYREIRLKDYDLRSLFEGSHLREPTGADSDALAKIRNDAELGHLAFLVEMAAIEIKRDEWQITVSEQEVKEEWRNMTKNVDLAKMAEQTRKHSLAILSALERVDRGEDLEAAAPMGTSLFTWKATVKSYEDPSKREEL